MLKGMLAKVNHHVSSTLALERPQVAVENVLLLFILSFCSCCNTEASSCSYRLFLPTTEPRYPAMEYIFNRDIGPLPCFLAHSSIVGVAGDYETAPGQFRVTLPT